MDPPAPPPRPEDDQRRKDAAFVLPLFGALVLTPPFLNLFTRRLTLWGIPLEALYLFGVWLGLVAGAFLLARRAAGETAPLRPSPEAPRDPAEEPAAPAPPPPKGLG